jgi:hypothetical protein
MRNLCFDIIRRLLCYGSRPVALRGALNVRLRLHAVQVLDDGPGVLLAEIELIGVLGPSQLHPSEGLTAV